MDFSDAPLAEGLIPVEEVRLMQRLHDLRMAKKGETAEAKALDEVNSLPVSNFWGH